MRQAFLPLLVLILGVLTVVKAVKFDLVAVTPDRAKENKRCLSQYVPKDTMILATVRIGQGYNQRVDLEIADDSPTPTVYVSKKDISNELRNAFNTHSDGVVSICFTNSLSEGFHESPEYLRTVDLDFNVGAEAMDFEKIAKAEKLNPLELELRKLETVVKEIVDEMNYLKRREARMRDTNESTNNRVKWFSILSLFTLIGLGTWQILYLRRFFKRKRLID
ncbi:emp24/gp25L/p24 family/GOLD-domain-containing protein [Phycomyces nitens]|nr:emp24/gp25L/p24 family/GOLD-domain-containing protein [Phycomyces nitens]